MDPKYAPDDDERVPRDPHYAGIITFAIFVIAVLFIVILWLIVANKAGAHPANYAHFHSYLTTVDSSALTGAGKPRSRSTTLRPLLHPLKRAPLMPTYEQLRPGTSQEQQVQPVFCINPRFLGAGSGTMVCSLTSR